MPEIEKLVTYIGIINLGKILFHGTLTGLMSKRRQDSFIIFETNDAAKTLQVISAASLRPRIESGKIAIPVLEKEQIAAVNQKLVRSGIAVYQIGKIESNLEEIFFDVIND